MFRKILFIPLLCLSMVFFMQCSDDPLSDDVTVESKKGPGGGTGGGPGGGGGGGGTETSGNNLSFPVFTADNFVIAPIGAPSFSEVYAGSYTGLSEEELAVLEGYDWYAQKVEGNVWQADFSVPHGAEMNVDYIDWGDVIESSNPAVGRPFRLEVTLYAQTDNDMSENIETMTGYVMALLENPSSPNEVQGTNTETYENGYATVVSASPRLVIQSFTTEPASWNAAGYWDDAGTPLYIGFAPELNVGGKYIYGASEGGWKPVAIGKYRLTFYMSTSSQIVLGGAMIANYSNGGFVEPETAASAPLVDAEYNITYVDVTVVSGRGGGKRL